MKNHIPEVLDLVLLGGGHSHALFLKMWAMNPVSGVRVTLITDVTHTPYSGMLPGHIGGEYSYDESHIDLRSLAMYCGCHFILAAASGVNLEKKTIKLEDRPDLNFDLLSINVGSTPNLAVLGESAQNVIPVKPVHKFLRRWEEVKDQVKVGKVKSIGIIGAGAGGVELALWMRKILGKEIKISLIQKSKQILSTHNNQVRKILTKCLVKSDVEIITAEQVTKYDDRKILCESGKTIVADCAFGLTYAKAPKWPAEAGLAVDHGFISVTQPLQSSSHPFVFAAGDIASIQGHKRAKTGVFAVRMGKPLYQNIKRLILNRPLKKYFPQKYYLNLIGTADGKAVASRRYLAAHGKIWWSLKDYIDVTFMQKLNNLGAMEEKEGPAIELDEVKVLNEKQKVKCLGCGAKVGGSILSRSLGRIKNEQTEPDVEGVLTDWRTPDDGALINAGSKNIVTSIDYFPALLDDPFILGRIAALHAFSDCFAMGAKPHSCLLQAQIPMMKDRLMEDTLYQLIKGVFYEINKMPAKLLGGHTTEGILGAGLQVNGLLDQALPKQGMVAAAKLVLTKPIGVGVLFAAQMQGKARGRWIDEAINSMLMSNQKAAELAKENGAVALTDITGFGLLGHLKEMLDKKHDVRLNLDSFPVLDGAIAMTEVKITSSLFDQNKNLSYEYLQGNTSSVLATLGHDPQTSGGLLCVIPAQNEGTFLQQLRENGHPAAATIGEVTEGIGQIHLS